MPETSDPAAKLNSALSRRFGEAVEIDGRIDGLAVLADMAARGSCRAFRDEPVDQGLIRLLVATALSSPAKSDLQQRDIIAIEDAGLRERIDALSGGGWVEGAPAFLVFCGNNRRQRQLHEWRGHPFANDHLDAFFNAAVDAAIALSAFVTAAEAVGLGCCPVSQIRNHPDKVSTLLGLPDHVFPVAGVAFGWPEEAPPVAPRLPLKVTLHTDRFNEADLREQVEMYDMRREALMPYGKQRAIARFGEARRYGWSEDKARQYAEEQRTDFGAFVRKKSFSLD